jgi:carbon starvation protein
VLAPAKTLAEMSRVVTNDYVNASLAAAFVALVAAMVVFGLIGIRRALANPRSTASEVNALGAMVGDD